MSGKLIIAAVLCVLAAAIPAYAAGGKEEGPAGVQTVSFLVLDYGRDKITDDLWVFKAMEGKTGVKVHPVPILESSYSEKINTMIAGGDLPDILTLDSLLANTYGPDGLFHDYAKDLPGKLPNLQALLERYPEVRRSVALDTKSLYSLPSFTEMTSWSWVPALRQDLLKEMGMQKSAVRTLDDLYAYLKRAKGMRNGGIQYPWTEVSAGDFVLKTVPDLYGIGGTGAFFYNKEADSFQYGPLTKEFLEYVSFVRKCYKEQLIHPEFLGLSRNENSQVFHNGNSALFHYPEWLILTQYNDEVKQFSKDNSIELTAIWPVSVGGKAFVPRRDTALSNLGKWNKAIYSKTKKLSAVLRLVNYLYGDEGRQVFYYGDKGKHWSYDEKGVFRVGVNMGWNQALVGDAPKYSELGLYNARYAFVRQPDLTDPNHRVIYDKLVAEKLASVQPPVPQVSLGREALETYASVMTQLSTFALEQCGKFVTGKRPIEEWDRFLNELQERGVAKALDPYNKAYRSTAGR